MNSRRIAALLLSIVAMLVFTGNSKAGPLSLKTAVELAFINDAGVRVRTMEAEAAGFDGWRTVAGYGPKLTISGSREWPNRELSPRPAEDDRSCPKEVAESAVEVELRQPLPDFGHFVGIHRGVAEIELSEVRRKLAAEELLLQVKERFYRVLSRQQQLRLAMAKSAILRAQAASTATRMTLGAGTILDQYRAEVRHRTAQASEVFAETEWERELEALEKLIDRNLEQHLPDPFPERDLPELPNGMEDWLQVALRNNTGLREKSLEVKIAQLEYRQTQDRFLPHLDLSASARWFRSDDGAGNRERTETRFGVRLEMDLLAGGRDTATLLAASKRKEAAVQREKAARRKLRRSVSSLWHAIQKNRELVFRYRQASEAGRLAMETSRLSYREGDTVLLDLLGAQRDYFRSLRQYHVSRYDYLVFLERFRITVGANELHSRGAPPLDRHTNDSARSVGSG